MRFLHLVFCSPKTIDFFESTFHRRILWPCGSDEKFKLFLLESFYVSFLTPPSSPFWVTQKRVMRWENLIEFQDKAVKLLMNLKMEDSVHITIENAYSKPATPKVKILNSFMKRGFSFSNVKEGFHFVQE
jgi:hypothetical protein